MSKNMRMRWRRLVLGVIRLALIAIAILFTTSVYAQGVEPRWFAIKTIDVQLAGLDPAFEGYKIVQLTDLHARSGIMDRATLAKVARIATAQQPDLIALTGDYITSGASKSEEMLANAFSLLQAKDGVVAIMGNHDRGEDSSPLERAFTAGKIKLLNNAVHSIERQGSRLNIAGVDDVWLRRANLPQTIAQLPNTGANILLAHEPDFGDIAAASYQFELQLSGHSHGGQIVLPFAPRVTPPLGRKYINGLYHLGVMQLYVSPGVGTTGPPKAIFNCRPEISVIVLHHL
ncbi:metallophosphoesterase [Chamaesiphon sp. OTE_8_metabat_110]|uniref:metallophosphoesterase n=1 Tax=Chamaesiphon sp. OTE_8_metabat_110 TaxID=2964696 RepID=UPI00286BDED3|nr:metallophosphoesterase [Chamaesiphon sp. OTE_8_metabat_110]